MSLEDINLWRQVNLHERVWNKPGEPHKMGWIHPGDIVHLIKRYNVNWYLIDPEDSTAPKLKPPHNADPEDVSEPFAYIEHWVKDNDQGLFVLIPEPPPPLPVPELSFWERIWDAILRFLEKLFGNQGL